MTKTTINNENVYSIGEIAELSDGNVKVLRMSDGTQQAVFDLAESNSEESNAAEMIALASVEDSPHVEVMGTASITPYSWDGTAMTSPGLLQVGITGGESSAESKLYMTLQAPTLPRNPRIKKVMLEFRQSVASFGGAEEAALPLIGLYKVTGELAAGTTAPANEENFIDYEKVRLHDTESGGKALYSFDITSVYDAIRSGEITNTNFVLKLVDPVTAPAGRITIDNCILRINYESSYAVNSAYRTHTHDLKRFGQGSVDLQKGNLMLEAEDFSWGGNRMPVTIKHVYNSALGRNAYTQNTSIGLNTANFTAMRVGYGWKLNIMQSMMPVTLPFAIEDGENASGYVYIGENGEEVYFKEGETGFEDVDGNGMTYDPETLTMKNGDDSYLFDANGRLVKITDKHGNAMEIVYESDRITAVKDGAGRNFNFAYDGNSRLSSISAPDGTIVNYVYANGYFLNQILYPDGAVVAISGNTKYMISSILVGSATSASSYCGTKYTYDPSYRVISAEEVSSADGTTEVNGAESEYSYSAASGRTLVTTTLPADADSGETEDFVFHTVYTFDDTGEVIGEYVYADGNENTAVNGNSSGINPYAGEGGAGLIPCSVNLLTNHSFMTTENWTKVGNTNNNIHVIASDAEKLSKFGTKLCYVGSSSEETTEGGISQITETLEVGEYTFSAYISVRTLYKEGVVTPCAFLRVTDSDGNILGDSEILNEKGDYVRLSVPFTITTPKSVNVQVLMNGSGSIYVDGAQLENNPFASDYNLLENGNFEKGVNGWTVSDESNVTVSAEACFNGTKALKITGDISAQRNAHQTVNVKTARTTRETFTLSGWAKGKALPEREREGLVNATFRLRACIKFNDPAFEGTSEEVYTADFSPSTEEWQFASVQFCKESYRQVESVKVYCDYDFNNSSVLFDNIQLVRNSIETDLSASDFVAEPEEIDADTEETEVTEDDVTDEEELAAFEELFDTFGNALTETTFTDGEFGTVYRSFEFNEAGEGGTNAGNDMVAETDALGNKTMYAVNETSSRVEQVTDRLGNKTAYEYDSAGRTTKVTSKDSADTELANVAYTYDAMGNMTEIVRSDGMKYALAYNAFGNLESIGVEGLTKDLVTYTYKNGNGRLKKITYANGDNMNATYNAAGQMVGEKWLNAAGATVAQYKYVYDGQGNIVRSIDITAQKEYTYSYEDGRIMRAVESDVEFDESGLITARNLVNTIHYLYDSDGNLAKKRIVSATGFASTQTVHYETPEDRNAIVRWNSGDVTVTSHSKTDSFGRKVFDELQIAKGFVSRRFSYYAGEPTEAHQNSDKLKSSATTQLVSQIALSDGRTLSYEYDAEERITKVMDSVEGITEYTYDALGQLLTEKHMAVGEEAFTDVNVMTYDGYGNIRSKNGVTYTYGNLRWKDRLSKVGGQTISYDLQGNPTTYLGHTLTWEKGRQLKTFDNNTYTYNANGIRTSKTVEGVKHTYVLDGAKILREEWDGNVMTVTYDNEDSVCGIVFNDTPFYFLKNLQGDVIAIINEYGDTVCRYTYDAWGKCTVIANEGVGIGDINPFRYRGYYYDREIGLYYVSSRYYDPEIGRWLNSDDAQFVSFSESLLSSNLFCYCHNSSINNIDENGKWLARVIGAVAVGAIFATLAHVVLKVVNAILKSVGRSPLNKKITTLITVGVGALGTVIGAILGPSFLAKYAPNLLKAINQIEKNKFSIKTIKPNSHGNIFGINISNTLIIMLHYPHAGKNEWNFHVQVEIHLFGKKQKEIGRWILLDVNKSTWEKWRRYFGNK